MSPEIHLLAATPGDAAALAAILNALVARGAPTAHQAPFAPEAFRAAFLTGPRALLCILAETAQGDALGFQHLERHPELPAGWAGIATFARPEPRRPGVGRALFARTRAEAAALDLATINATIRADNAAGLGYYAAMGFRKWRLDPAMPLADGRPVDRIATRLDLAG
jgi:L-amino acid N-acyltransferase YncA